MTKRVELGEVAEASCDRGADLWHEVTVMMRGAARDIFLAAIDDPALRAPLEAIPTLDAWLEDAAQRAAQAWPALTLGEGTFWSELGSRLRRQPPAPDALARWFDHVQCADFHLAVACAQGIPGAIDAFETAYAADLRRLIARYQGDDLPAEDLRQALREKLFVGGPDRPPKIEDYAGQGFLQNWLRVMATRTFIDLLRASSRRELASPSFDPEQLLAMPDPAHDVELDFLKREYRAHFKAAFDEAARALSSQQRNLLRQAMVAQLTVEQLGRLYGVHASTASRRVTAAREALVEGTRRALLARLQISPDELDSIMGLIRSRLDLSLSRALKTHDETREGAAQA